MITEDKNYSLKLLVTGGTGLVGSAIKGGIKLSSNNGDLINTEDTFKIFETLRPEKVIHCAARVGGLGGIATFPDTKSPNFDIDLPYICLTIYATNSMNSPRPFLFIFLHSTVNESNIYIIKYFF